jgi:glycosyltransferase involved in cell wall biosynthesis
MSSPFSDRQTDLAILVSFSGEGGVERMVLNLVNAIAQKGIRVDLLLIKTDSQHLQDIHPSINRIDLGSSHTLTSLLPLMRYLKRVHPPCLLAAKDRAGRIAVIARALAGANETRLGLRLGTNLSAAFAHKSPWRMRLRQLPIRLLYPSIDVIIAVSEGVKQDILKVSAVKPSRVKVVRNPVITRKLVESAAAPVPHPWLVEMDRPVILGAGRLTLQKDFQVLIRAFALLHKSRACRLIILGEGRQRAELENLARKLGVAEDLALPGFAANPYAYMRHAKLFVLTSRWEGSPNVLTEAMALGTPVVATDCPSGPNELLNGGRVAPLVDVGDWRGLAEAMAQVLDNPMAEETLQQAVHEYNAETSATRYLEIMGLNPNTAADAAVD